jgi:hypothetical protein
MRGRALAFLAVTALLAGCLGSDQAQAPDVAVAEPVAPKPFVGTCDSGLLFQFVPYGSTDRWLPPGFHPRDPQDFLGSPVAFGQAAVILLIVDCAAPDGTVLRSASVDIFVESPVVEGVDPARFDFYEIERYGDPAELDGALLDSGWLRLPGEVRFGGAGGPGGLPSTVGYSVLAEVADGNGTIMSMIGPVAADVPLADGPVRFWHESEPGVSYIEYDVSLQPRVGTGSCSARAGTALAQMLPASPVAGTLGVNCPPGTPIVALLPDMAVNVTAQHLRGVRAG